MVAPLHDVSMIPPDALGFSGPAPSAIQDATPAEDVRTSRRLTISR